MEIWRPVVGYEGRYEVSNLGNLRSLKFRGVCGENLMKSSKNYNGYHVVSLGKERKQFRLHVLVLEAFVGPRPEGMQGCHRDNDKSNNSLSNLRWDTPKGNISDRRDYSGEGNPNAKLTREQTVEIAARRQDGETTTILAAEFGISNVRVCQIAKLRDRISHY